MNLHDYGLWNDTYHTRCGTTYYTQGWIYELAEAGSDEFKEINENLFALDNPKQVNNTIEILKPLRINLFTSSNHDVGNYKYFIEARMSDVNLTDVFFRYEFHIEVTPCVTTQTIVF